MHGMDRQDPSQIFDLARLPMGVEIRKYMAQHHLVNEYPPPNLPFQLLPSRPEITQYLPREYIGLPLITRKGKALY